MNASICVDFQANLRLSNSLKNDPTLRISLTLTNYLFALVRPRFSSPLLVLELIQPILVGNNGFPIHFECKYHRPKLPDVQWYVGSPWEQCVEWVYRLYEQPDATIQLRCRSWIHKVRQRKYYASFSAFWMYLLHYTHSKDLWFENSTVYSTPNQRSGLDGLAFIGNPCSPSRYCIVEEVGGMVSTRVSYFYPEWILTKFF